MFKKKIATSPLCPICNSSQETLEHMFLICQWTRPLWFALNICATPTGYGISNMAVWISQTLGNIFPNVDSWIFYALWLIWKARNDFVFNGMNPNHMYLLYQTLNLCSEFLLSLENTVRESGGPSLNISSFPKVWRPPTSPFLKINCDAAFDIGRSKGSAGIICRDENGYL